MQEIKVFSKIIRIEILLLCFSAFSGLFLPAQVASAQAVDAEISNGVTIVMASPVTSVISEFIEDASCQVAISSTYATTLVQDQVALNFNQSALCFAVRPGKVVAQQHLAVAPAYTAFQVSAITAAGTTIHTDVVTVPHPSTMVFGLVGTGSYEGGVGRKIFNNVSAQHYPYMLVEATTYISKKTISELQVFNC